MLALVIACGSYKGSEPTNLELLGEWVEDYENSDRVIAASIDFIDNTTLALKTEQMPTKMAYRYEVDAGILVLFYQNSHMEWVEGLRCPFKINDDRLVISYLDTTGTNDDVTVFRKIKEDTATQ